MRAAGAGDLLRRARGHHLAAPVAALRTQVHDPVRLLDHVEVVLDQHHRVALLDQQVQHLQQLPHVLEVQAGGGLVQQVNGPAGAALGQLQRQLDALRLAAGQGQGRLPQLDVGQPDVVERGQAAGNRGDDAKELERLLDGHLQDLMDIASLVTDVQGLAVVASPLAHVAGDVHVGQEVHLDLDLSAALAVFTAAALDVEREAARLVAARLGFGERGEQVADGSEEPDVGGRVGARRAADGRLVDVDHLVDPFDPLQAPVGAHRHPRAAHGVGQRRVQHVAQQGRLARSRHAGDHREGAQGQVHVDLLEVVLAGAHHAQQVAVAGPPPGRQVDAAGARQVAAGHGSARRHHLLQRAGGGDVAAVDPGARSQVDDVVGAAQGLLVVLHHDQGVAQVPEVEQGLQQALVVTLVQPDGRLVEDVEHSHQGGTDLGGQPDALRFAAGEGGGAPVQGEVLQPDAGHEGEAVAHLLQDLRRDLLFRLAEADAGEEVHRLLHAHVRDLIDVALLGIRVQGHRQRFATQPGTAAAAAVMVTHVLLQPLLHALRRTLAVAPPQVVQDAPIARGVAVAAVAALIPVAHLERLAGAAQQGVEHLGWEVAERRVQSKVEVICQGLEQTAVPRRLGVVRRHRALVEAEPGIGDHQLRIELHLDAQAGAVGTGAERVVETEQPRLQLGKRRATDAAGAALGELAHLLAALSAGAGTGAVDGGTVAATGRRAAAGAALQGGFGGAGGDRHRCLARRLDERSHAPRGQLQGGLHRLRQPFLHLPPDHQPVHHQLQRVLAVLVEDDLLVERADLTVHPHPHEAGAPGIVQDLAMLALAAADHRRQQYHPAALGEAHHGVDDLVQRLLLDGSAADVAVRVADAGIQQAQVVVDLRYRAHGGARVAVHGLLLDRDGRRQALDVVHVGLVQTAQKLARIGGEGLDVAALPLGEDGVEGERGLARAAETGDDDEAIARQLQVDRLEIVLAGPLDADVLHASFTTVLPAPPA